jgi:hypothetical protein
MKMGSDPIGLPCDLINKSLRFANFQYNLQSFKTFRVIFYSLMGL